MFQAFLTGIPVVAVVKDIPEAFYLILTFLLFAVCMAVLLLIFLPKVLVQRTYGKMTPTEQRKAMSVSVELSAGKRGGLNSTLMGRILQLDAAGNISGIGSMENPSSTSPRSRPGPLGSSEAAKEERRNNSQAVSNDYSNTCGEISTSKIEDNRPISSVEANGESDGFGSGGVTGSDGGAFVKRLDNASEPAVYSSYIDNDTLEA
jgi:hypothetical protein